MRRRTFGKWSTGRARRAAGTHRDASLGLRAPHTTRRTTHVSLIPRLRPPLYRSVLYTDVFCTRRELREMFDHTLLDKCTKRLDCADAFPQVFDKVKPEAGIVDLAAEVAAEEEAAAKKGGWFGGMANGGAKLEAAKKARAAASPAGARASPAKNGHNGHANGETKNGRNNGIHA